MPTSNLFKRSPEKSGKTKLRRTLLSYFWNTVPFKSTAVPIPAALRPHHFRRWAESAAEPPSFLSTVRISTKVNYQRLKQKIRNSDVTGEERMSHVMKMCMGCHKHLNGNITRPTTDNNPEIIYEVLFGIEELADIIKRAHRLCALVSLALCTSQGFLYWWCNWGVAFQHRSSFSFCAAQVEINCNVAVTSPQLRRCYSSTVQTLPELSRLITR